MRRPLLLVCSPDPATAELISQCLVLTETTASGSLPRHKLLEPVIPEGRDFDSKGLVPDLQWRLEALPLEDLRNLMVVVDATVGRTDFAIKITNSTKVPSPEHQLILAFPEVYFLFLRGGKVDDADVAQPACCWRSVAHACDMDQVHAALEAHRSGFRPLFDPGGVRARCRGEDPKAAPLAVAIEDETAQLYLNGYLLYRFGFRTGLVATKAEFIRLRDTKLFEYARLVLEDVELAFADLSIADSDHKLFFSGEEPRAPDLESRWVAMLPNAPKLQPTRVLLTADDRRTECEHCVQKPFAGFYEGALNKLLAGGRDSPVRSNSPKHSPGSHHSVVGGSRAIAEQLLRRSGRILSGAAETTDALDLVEAAVLAEEARRLLGGKNPLLSLMAIEIREQAEVAAECSFSGVTERIEVEGRLAALWHEVQEVTRGDRWKATNAFVGILADLRRIYGDYEKFDEQVMVATELATQTSTLSYLRRRRIQTVRPLDTSTLDAPGGPRPLSRTWSPSLQEALTHPRAALFLYSEQYLNYLYKRGFLAILGAALVSALYLAFLGALIDPGAAGRAVGALHPAPAFSAYCAWLAGLLNSFFGLDGLSGSVTANILNLAAAMIGVIHIGILISWLFQKATRR